MPELAKAIEAHQVIRIDEYRYAKVDELKETGELKEAPLKEEAAAASSSSARATQEVQAATPQDRAWGDSILAGSQSSERAAKRGRKEERLVELKRNEENAANAAAQMRYYHDCA